MWPIHIPQTDIRKHVLNVGKKQITQEKGNRITKQMFITVPIIIVTAISYIKIIKKYETYFSFQLTCPTEETPLSVLPHLEYCKSFFSLSTSLVFSRALNNSDCKKDKKYSQNTHDFIRNIQC